MTTNRQKMASNKVKLTLLALLLSARLSECNDTIKPMLEDPLLRSSDEIREEEITREAIKETVREEEERDPISVQAEGTTVDNVAAAEEVTSEQNEVSTVAFEEATSEAATEAYKDADGSEKVNDSEEDYTVKVDSTSTTTTSTTAKPTTTTTTTVPPPVDNELTVEPVLPKSTGDLDAGVQRNPKTDNSETTRQAERPSDIFKPQTKASKSLTLRSWLEDQWLRQPPAILVPLRSTALTRALSVWNDLTSSGDLNLSDIIVVGFDSTGINWRSRHNLLGHPQGNRAVNEVLSKLLYKYQDVPPATQSGDATMKALSSSAKLVPYDSAIFLFTDKGPADAAKFPLALRALVEKRLKVYTIWTDPRYPTSNAAIQDLRNVSVRTEGELLPYSITTMEEESTMENEGQLNGQGLPQTRMARLNTVDENLQTLLVKRGAGTMSLGVPVETGVRALRVFIEGAVEHAVLYPPNDGPQIDLYNLTSVESFSPGSKTDGLSPRDVSLVFPGTKPFDDMLSVLPMRPLAEGRRPTAGVWHLSMRCGTCDFRLTISASATIRFDVDVGDDDMLNIRLVGPVATVREASIVDEYGTEMAKLDFSYQPAAGEEDPRVGDDQELMAEIPIPNVKGAKLYAKIVGRDLYGESFVRLSKPINRASERIGRSASFRFPETINDLEIAEVFNERAFGRLRYNDSNILANGRAGSQVVNQAGSILTAVQIGPATRIYGAPGNSLQLHFEVTNYREQSVSFRFEAVGELRFLTGISPLSQTLGSGQSVNVIVSLTISSASQPGARDLITFTAYGLDQVSISSYVYVTNSDLAITDFYAPEVRHNFQGTCIGRLGQDCSQHIWSASVIARDANGGLLRLTSTPIGLMYDSNFIAGTREEVIATYRSTCCAPRVLISAVDAYGNTNSYVIDISNYFTPASVAAIVLGVFLFIAIIALIVFLIYICVKRRQESRELPYVTSTSRRDIN